MIDQYFGIKELYEVVLRAKVPMKFGSRYFEAEEPVLYFENVNISLLTERTRPIIARGGWANMPRIIWEDRNDVTFTLSEGVMSSIGMSILFGCNVFDSRENKPLLVNKREGPMYPNEDGYVYLAHWPVDANERKTFIFAYDRNVAQKKIYGKRIFG